MKAFEGDEEARQILRTERLLPEDPRSEHVVVWRTFRNEDQAVAFSRHILLEDGQRVVGGRGRDDVGAYHWIGVEVDDLEKWGHPGAIQLCDPLDADDPRGQGRKL